MQFAGWFTNIKYNAKEFERITSLVGILCRKEIHSLS